MVGKIFSVLSAVLITWCYIPYARDIIKGKVKPARSARIMFAALTTLALLQQHSLGSGWTVAVTLGEVVGSLAILILALQKGVGGLRQLDIVCYVLLILSVGVWLTTKNAFLALHLTVLADFIAMYPTLHKTWYHPETETALFFAVGVIAPLMSIVAGGQYAYAIILFPLYLAVINSIEVGLIYRKQPAANGDILAK